jgi:hypothetical protein
MEHSKIRTRNDEDGTTEYCTVNEPHVRKIKPSIAEDRATGCVVRSHKHISAINTSGILKKHA